MGKLASSGLSDVIEKGSLKGLPSMAFWLALQDHGRMKALGGVCTLGDSQTHTQWTAWEKFWPWNLLVWFVRILGHNPLTILRLFFFQLQLPSSLITHGSTNTEGLLNSIWGQSACGFYSTRLVFDHTLVFLVMDYGLGVQTSQDSNRKNICIKFDIHGLQSAPAAHIPPSLLSVRGADVSTAMEASLWNSMSAAFCFTLRGLQYFLHK